MHSDVIIGDLICLAVPPDEELSKVLRLATTAVAGRCGFNIDQSDDLNTAIDEVFKMFITLRKPNELRFSLQYEIMPDRLEVLAHGCGSYTDAAGAISNYSRFLLESLSDAVEDRPNELGTRDLVLIKMLPKD